MNGRRDIERTLDLWLVDGPSRMPDRLFDAVLDRVERTPQRRLSRLTLRLSEMHPRIRLYGLAAAGLVVAIVGLSLFTRAPISTPGGTTNPSGSPTPAPTTEVPAALREMWMGPEKPLPGNDPGAGVVIDFSVAGSFSMTQSAGGRSQHLRSDVIVLPERRIELVANGEDADCDEGAVGTYIWSISESGRKLSLVEDFKSDPCPLRLSSVPGLYWLMDCPTAEDNCLGEVDPGTYSSQFFDPWVAPGGAWHPRFDALSYTVPDGWTNASDWPQFFDLRPVSAPDGTNVSLTSNIVVSDQGQLCAETQDESIGTTASEISTFLASATGVVASAPEPVSLGGLTGFRLDIGIDPTWTEACPWSDGKPVRMLLAHPPAADGFSWAIETDHDARLYFLDVADGRTLAIIIEARTPTDFDAFVDAVTPVIESFVFTP